MAATSSSPGSRATRRDHAARRPQVAELMIKPARKEKMRPLREVRAQARNGLLGDCHARPLGPRQVLVVAQESLAELGVSLWQVRGNIATRNLELDELPSGTVLAVGARARFRLTHACEVCQILRSYVSRDAFRALPGRRGYLGVVLTSGTIAVGDSVSIERHRYPSVPEGLYDRLAWVVAQIPTGKTVNYDVLLDVVGSSRSYFRVLPRYLQRADCAGLPAHRVLTSHGEVTGHLSDQAERLALEGVDLSKQEENSGWDPRQVYQVRT
jgi:alkylated DNA nucleotide flippase Atl1